MKAHEETEQILAIYRDASSEERAAADAHLATCATCAARFGAFAEVDRALSAAPDPALPPRLARPFSALLKEQAAASSRAVESFVLRGRLAPAAIVLILLVAISVLLWSGNTANAPVSSTPTLTMTTTLTPTIISARQTVPAVLAAFGAAHGPLPAPAFAPTPAASPAARPVPAPERNPAILFAGSAVRATISH